MKYDIIIFDIGKTLFDKRYSPVASDLVLRDIEALRKQGIKVGVCTMRNVKHCKEVVPVELDFYISLNGSYITCEGAVIVDNSVAMPPDCIDYLSYNSNHAFYSSEQAKMLAEANGFLAEQKGLASPVYNAVLFNVCSDKLSNYSGYTTEYWENTNTLVLQNSNTSRLIGIQEVLNYYKIKSQPLYFGDGPNDLKIFQTYQDCICMGNCYPKLKQYALFQTKSCESEGVPIALRKLNLLH